MNKEKKNKGKKKLFRKVQSMVEYAFLIGTVSAALIAMNTYAKRGIQAVVKLSADTLSEGAAGGQAGAISDNQQTWFIEWQPDEPKRDSSLRNETLKKQQVDSAGGKITAAEGSLRKSGAVYTYSVSSMKEDKVIE
ncbi:MAG: hypothetical protein ABH858_02930 [Candidatus Omnitrophota bacterium]